ncbi:MAG: radical SAM protein [Planctomycetes bacterium]|nr:radical SAM protein [Planctomycetota bacterium]MBM4087412.1 radical SAM protein [Planctomycetota bacterium]
MLFAQYQPAHRARLQALLETGEWQEVLAAPALLSQWKGERRVPPASPGQMSGAVEYLKKRNAERAKALLREGLTEEKALASALGDWRAAVDGPVCRDAHGTGREDPFPILFLGLVLTLDCSFQPRCLYCNQVWLPRRLGLAEWKALLAEAAHPTPPYVYLTGGEPLVLEEEIWGDDGLVAFATRLGCAVNLNTNGALITPRVALQLVKVGLARLHISLDSADPEVQAELF